tara:strand:+ start:99 stop:368 length:270 start_codon:yes stop_codon:yes gene_type:complete
MEEIDMSLSQTERDQRDTAQMGMLSSDLREIAETSLYRVGMDDRNGDGMLVMSILSDAQMVMSCGDTEMARQYVNRAKYIISHYIMERE